MRILSVPQRLADVIFKEKFLGKAGLGTHPGRYRHIILRRVGIGFCGKFQTCLPAGMTIGLELGNDCRIVLRIDHNRHALPILGRTSDHRWASDVDVLDGIFHRHIRLGYGLTEWIEVDTHQVNSAYSVVFQLLHVVWNIPSRQQGPVDFRMEGLDSAVADFGEAGYIAYARHRQPCLFQQSHSTTGGKQFPPQRHKFTGEFNHARLVANTDQSPHFLLFIDYSF